MNLDRFRYVFLAGDPGLQQLKHAAKTVLAVVAALEAFRFAGSQVALYAGMSAGFLMQSTAGEERRTRQMTMAWMGFASTLAVGLGSELSAQHWAKQILLVGAAFAAYYVRRFIPGKAMFPLFAFVLTLLATVQPGGAGSTLPMMAAIFGGFVSAFLTYFYLLPDETPRAFRHAAELFLFRLQQARKREASAKVDLRAMHRAVVLEEEEQQHLGLREREVCSRLLTTQYDALQLLTLIVDMQGQPPSPSRQKAWQLSHEYLAEIVGDLETQRELLDA